MWTCHKCQKPVYFAERKQSLGYDWHPECLRCEECGKRLNPGQHSEHKGVPYCHVPCYSALFGPTLFGHGSQVECHKSFGKVESRQCTLVERSHLEAKLRIYNQFYEGKSQELKARERNGKLILEGVLRIYWGVNNLIHLKEDDDQRTHIQVRKRNSYRQAINNGYIESPDSDSANISDVESIDVSIEEKEKSESQPEPKILNNGVELKHVETKTVPEPKKSPTTENGANENPVRIRKMASSRSRSKLRRRCSINGHYYNRETSVFTPSYGSATHVWVTSMVNGPEVINMLLDKFRVENPPQNFALFVVRDNGETRRLQDTEYPLLVRVNLGPHEDVAKVFIMDKRKTNEISSEVAQFLNLSLTELKAISFRYQEEEQRELAKVKFKFKMMRKQMQELLLRKS
uniref:LIM zinc-binding domain-containing protein n=1 Tax=Strigamia maritima TaxID=126957 RepID=T1IQK5_STRMM